jgi:raffinose/stachyose/melibiose transport system permease protein
MGTLRFRPSVLLFMLPAFALYAVFFLVPFARTLWSSLFEWNGMDDAVFVGLGNYAELAHDALFRTGFARVGLWAALAVLLKVGIALLLASALRERIPGSRFFEVAFFVPVVISSAAISLLFTLLYDGDIGLVNAALRAVGLGSLARAWLADQDTALLAVIAVPIWHTIGYFFVILLAAQRDIPRELFEAARIDGAGARVTFTHITIPALAPVLTVCAILAVTAALKSFDYVFVMTRGGPGTSTEVPVTTMYKTIFVNLQIGYGTAMATTIFLVALAATLAIRALTRFGRA